MSKQVKEREIEGYEWVANEDPWTKRDDKGNPFMFFSQPSSDRAIKSDYAFEFGISPEDVLLVTAQADSKLKAVYIKKQEKLTTNS